MSALLPKRRCEKWAAIYRAPSTGLLAAAVVAVAVAMAVAVAAAAAALMMLLQAVEAEPRLACARMRAWVSSAVKRALPPSLVNWPRIDAR